MRIYDTEIRYSLRMQVAYEQITGHAYTGRHPVTDSTTLLYCALVTAKEPPEGLTYDGLLEWLDEHPVELVRFGDWLRGESERVRLLTSATSEEEDDKKKD